jgi:hypothetical protein
VKATDLTGRIKVHNEELNNLYSSTDLHKMKENTISGICYTNGGNMMDAYKILVGKTGRKRYLARPRHR